MTVLADLPAMVEFPAPASVAQLTVPARPASVAVDRAIVDINGPAEAGWEEPLDSKITAKEGS